MGVDECVSFVCRSGRRHDEWVGEGGVGGLGVGGGGSGVGVGVFEGGKKRCLSFFFAFLIRSLVVEMFDDQNEQQTTIRCLEVDELLVIKSYQA